MDRDETVRQFAAIAAVFAEVEEKAGPTNTDFSDIPLHEVTRFSALCLAFLERAGGAGSSYARHAQALIDHYKPGNTTLIPLLFGVAEALNDDINHGFVRQDG